jgi:hypothetical protein
MQNTHSRREIIEHYLIELGLSMANVIEQCWSQAWQVSRVHSLKPGLF